MRLRQPVEPVRAWRAQPELRVLLGRLQRLWRKDLHKEIAEGRRTAGGRPAADDGTAVRARCGVGWGQPRSQHRARRTGGCAVRSCG
eukprot:4010548-Prymnesium_polylepis.1